MLGQGAEPVEVDLGEVIYGILRAAGEVGAHAVLAESSFADLGTMIASQVAVLGPATPAARAAVGVAARIQLGIDVDAVSPRASLLALPPGVRVALLHAGDDRVVPLAEGQRLAAARPGTAFALGVMIGPDRDPRNLVGGLVGYAVGFCAFACVSWLTYYCTTRALLQRACAAPWAAAADVSKPPRD